MAKPIQNIAFILASVGKEEFSLSRKDTFLEIQVQFGVVGVEKLAGPLEKSVDDLSLITASVLKVDVTLSVVDHRVEAPRLRRLDALSRKVRVADQDIAQDQGHQVVLFFHGLNLNQ